MRSRARNGVIGMLTLAVAGLTLAGLGGPADAGTATGGSPRAAQHASARAAAGPNPLAGRPWGVYRGLGDQVSAPYAQASAQQRALLASIAERPRAKWFGAWIPDSQIASVVRSYIDETTGGDPETLVQMAIFRMVPWEHEACTRLPTAAEQASYKTWIDRFAEQVGATHAMIVLQPDGPFALCAPGGSKKPSHLVRYAARALSALPNTAVYIDAGASDWNRDNPQRAVHMLLPAGISYARGLALNSTHYASTEDEVRYGAAVVRALAKRGVGGKKVVINTSSNGRGFDGYTYGGGNFDNAKVCRSDADRDCVTLGIPPTTDVADPAWGLSAKARKAAASTADAYLWFGRPWLREQADPFVMKRALQLASTTPYAGLAPSP